MPGPRMLAHLVAHPPITSPLSRRLVRGPGPLEDADPRQPFGETEMVDDARGVRADLDAGADFAQCARLLVDVNVETGVQQIQRSRRRGPVALQSMPGLGLCRMRMSPVPNTTLHHGERNQP